VPVPRFVLRPHGNRRCTRVCYIASARKMLRNVLNRCTAVHGHEHGHAGAPTVVVHATAYGTIWLFNWRCSWTVLGMVYRLAPRLVANQRAPPLTRATKQRRDSTSAKLHSDDVQADILRCWSDACHEWFCSPHFTAAVNLHSRRLAPQHYH
jgi:hypothetical protein